MHHARTVFAATYKDLLRHGWKPTGPHQAIRPDVGKYRTVEIRPNGDVFGTWNDLKVYLSECGLSGKRSGQCTVEAHHLLQSEYMQEYGVGRGEGRCVALEADDHVDMHDLGDCKDIEEVYRAHVEWYRRYGVGEWESEIRSFLRDVKKRIVERYQSGKVPGANEPNFEVRKRRALDFLSSLR